MALNAPASIDVTDYQFKLHDKLSLFKSNHPENTRSVDLLATSSCFGLVFAGCPDQPELKAFQLQKFVDSRESGVNVPIRVCPLPSAPHCLAISCDGRLLALNYTLNGSAFVALYDVPSFLSHNIILKLTIRIAPEQNVFAKQILWNPVMSSTFAVVMNNGVLGTYILKDAGYEFYSVPSIPDPVSCACWSPKGKQIVAGFPNGKLVQFKPDLKVAKTIPCPPNIHQGPFNTIAIQWLSTYQFAAVFLTQGADMSPALHIINAPKTGATSYINYHDICYSSCGPRPTQVFLNYIQPWNLLLVASANSMEAGLLGTTETTELPNWQQYITPDEARLELPLTSDKQETFPIGFTFDTGTTHQLIVGESRIPVMPMIHILSTYGYLVSFNFLNLSPNAVGVCSPPQPLSDLSGLNQFQVIVDTSTELSTPPVQSYEASQSMQQQKQQQQPVPRQQQQQEQEQGQQQQQHLPPREIEKFNLDFLIGYERPKRPDWWGLPTAEAYPQMPKPDEIAPGNLFGGALASSNQQQTTLPFGQPLPGTAGGVGFPPMQQTKPLFGGTGTVFGGAPAIAPATTTATSAPPPIQQQPIAFGQMAKPKEEGHQDPKPALLGDGKSLSNSEKSKPLYTIPPAYSATSLQPSQDKRESRKPATDVDSSIKDINAEQTQILMSAFIESFDLELKELPLKSKNLNTTIGDMNESKQIIRQLKSFQELTDQAEESTDSLSYDIHVLRNSLIESFAMVTEVRTKLEVFQNPEIAQASTISTLSQTNRRQLTKLRNMLSNNEACLQIVNQHIDAQWSNYQDLVHKNSKLKMHIPSLEGVYQTLTKQNDILARQRQKLNRIKLKLGIKGNLTHSSNIRPKVDVESLTDSILSLSMSEKVMEENSKLSDEKLQGIRDAARDRKIVTIRPQRPERKGLKSEVVLEVRKKSETLKKLAAAKSQKTESQKTKDEIKPISKSTVANTSGKVAPQPTISASKSEQKPAPIRPGFITPNPAVAIPAPTAQPKGLFVLKKENPIIPNVLKATDNISAEEAKEMPKPAVLFGVPANNQQIEVIKTEPSSTPLPQTLPFGIGKEYSMEPTQKDDKDKPKTSTTPLLQSFSFGGEQFKKPENPDMPFAVDLMGKLVNKDAMHSKIKQLHSNFLQQQNQNTVFLTDSVTISREPVEVASKENEKICNPPPVVAAAPLSLSASQFNISSLVGIGSNNSTNNQKTQQQMPTFGGFSLSQEPAKPFSLFETTVTSTPSASTKSVLVAQTVPVVATAAPATQTSVVSSTDTATATGGAAASFTFSLGPKTTSSSETTNITTSEGFVDGVTTKPFSFSLGSSGATADIASTFSFASLAQPTPIPAVAQPTTSVLFAQPALVAPAPKTEASTIPVVTSSGTTISAGQPESGVIADSLFGNLNICKPTTSADSTGSQSQNANVFNLNFLATTSAPTSATETKSIFGGATPASTAGLTFGTAVNLTTTTSATVTPFGGTPVAATTSTPTIPFGQPPTSTAVSAPAAVPPSSAAPFGTPPTSTSGQPSIFAAAALPATSTSSPFGAPTSTSGPAPLGFGSTPGTFGTTSASSASSIFGGAGIPKPDPSVFAATSTTPPVSSTASPFGVAAASNSSPFGLSTSTPQSSGGNIFGSSVAAIGFGPSPVVGSTQIFGGNAASPGAASPFGGVGAANATGQSASPFGAVGGNTTGAAFGSSLFSSPNQQQQQQPASGGSLFGSSGFGNVAQPSGGSIFGGQANPSQSTNVFGGAGDAAAGGFGAASGFGSNSFGQPASFGMQQSSFGQTTFGSTSPGGSFAQGGPSIAQTGFGSPQPSTNAFAKPVFGGSPTFGATPTFGGAPSFGSPKGNFSSFATPSPTGFTAPAQKNNLFESLGSSDTSLSFGNLAQSATAQGSKPQFGGQSFSTWR